MADHETRGIVDEFNDLVNLTAKQLDDWLKTDQSKAVGQKKDGAENTGHHMVREIVSLPGKKKANYADDDHAAMRKVIGYIKRHSAQRPEGDVEHTPWRYSPMNWGHDPLKT